MQLIWFTSTCMLPRTDHLATVRRILKYLKGSPGQESYTNQMGILEHKHIHMPIGLDLKQTESLLHGIALWLAAIFCPWKSKKQAVTAKSSAEVEYLHRSPSIYL